MNTKQLYDSNNEPFYPVVNNIGGGAGEIGSNILYINIDDEKLTAYIKYEGTMIEAGTNIGNNNLERIEYIVNNVIPLIKLAALNKATIIKHRPDYYDPNNSVYVNGFISVSNIYDITLAHETPIYDEIIIINQIKSGNTQSLTTKIGFDGYTLSIK